MRAIKKAIPRREKAPPVASGGDAVASFTTTTRGSSTLFYSFTLLLYTDFNASNAVHRARERHEKTATDRPRDADRPRADVARAARAPQ